MTMQTTTDAKQTSSGTLRDIALLYGRIHNRLKPALVTRVERYGARRDLAIRRDMLAIKVPVAVRPMTPSDVEVLFPENASALSRADQLEVAWRRMFIAKAGIASGLVVVDERNDMPCGALWLFRHADNDVVRNIGGFPSLGPDDVLMEGAYAPRAYRGVGVMVVATEMVAREAAANGARYMYTFIGTGNRASLKTAHRVGFEPYMMHTQRFRLFGLLKDDRFDVVADDDPRRRWEF